MSKTEKKARTKHQWTNGGTSLKHEKNKQTENEALHASSSVPRSLSLKPLLIPLRIIFPAHFFPHSQIPTSFLPPFGKTPSPSSHPPSSLLKTNSPEESVASARPRKPQILTHGAEMCSCFIVNLWSLGTHGVPWAKALVNESSRQSRLISFYCAPIGWAL